MLLPIACRFVPFDQWCLTHVDDASKVNQLKLWFLHKSNLVQSPGPHTQRSVSPIVFASTVRARSSIDTLDDGYSEDDEFSDHDLPPAIYPHREHKPDPHPPTSPLVDQYALLAFSTGALLEDDFPLSWYHIRPYELLEMHPVGFVAPLCRDVLQDYVQPYFQARVRVLRSLWSPKSGRFDASGPDAAQKAMEKLAQRLDILSTKSSPSYSDKKRKAKVEWKSRWLVIHQGLLSVCKEHVTNSPVQQFALTNMTALRGTDALERAFSIVTHPRVVCIKFRPRSPSLTSPPPSLPSSPISEDLKINPRPHDPATQTAEHDPHDSDDPCKGRGEWIVLDMLDDHAFSSILRILHRQAPHPISSSFVSSPSIIVAHNSIPSPAASSFALSDTVPYPEWRINTVENARKAGVGDVGKAMARVLWNEKGFGESLLGDIRHHRQAFAEETQYKVTFPAPDVYCGSDDESDSESELEWEGWMRDLERQAGTKQCSEKASKSVAPNRPPSTSLPSPPLSEASPSGSPRVRSPPLAAHTQYPNIGNVIQASGAHAYRSPEHAHSPKNTTVSTVSVGQLPWPRRRSKTLLSDLGVTRRDPDKPSLQGARAATNARTASISAGLRSPSTATPVRHARSSSNLRAHVSPYASDAAESGIPGPSSPSKRQSAFMRGVSLRAGRLVRGLESAIDFVDEKTA